MRVFLGEIGQGPLVGVSVTIAMLWAEKGVVIISGILENGGAEKTAPIHVTI